MRLAPIAVRRQADAIGLERIERIGNLVQAPPGVNQRDRGKAAEPAGMVGDQLGGVVVALARQLAHGFAEREIEADVVTDSIATATPALSIS
jgi:hypothetical protein